jgi:hypothetical protein
MLLQCALIVIAKHIMANPALNLAPFSRWTLRDKAAQRRFRKKGARVELKA